MVTMLPKYDSLRNPEAPYSGIIQSWSVLRTLGVLE